MSTELLSQTSVNSSSSSGSNINVSLLTPTISPSTFQSPPNNFIANKPNRPKFFCSESIVDEADTEDAEDSNTVIEESPTGRWSKLDTEIFVQRLPDFDSTHLALDTERGRELAWNEIRYSKTHAGRHAHSNRFDSIHTLEMICDKIKPILTYLCKLDHFNILKFYDYWPVENDKEFKLVVITEYSTGGSLKKLLDSSKWTKSKIKSPTYKRWLNQILYSIKCLHNQNISFFQGHLNSETIFIQNCGVIKLAPTLLSLSGVCELSGGYIRCLSVLNAPAAASKKLNIDLTSEVKIKDFQAIGRLAVEIFTAHCKSPHSSTPGSPHHHHRKHRSLDFLSFMFDQCDKNAAGGGYGDLDDLDLSMLDDEMQRDFCRQCFSSQASIESIWYHPFINNLHSLKVLSVFSILHRFQEKEARSRRNEASKEKDAKLKQSLQPTSPTSSILNSDSSNSLGDTNKDTSTVISITANNSESSLSYQQFKELERKSSSSSSLCRMMRVNQLGAERRKVSLTFLANCNNLTIPQDFFIILEDIRSGLYPRLFSKESCDLKDSSVSNLRAIPPSTCIDFVLEQKKMIDRRSSSAALFLNLNELELPQKNSSSSSVLKAAPSENEPGREETAVCCHPISESSEENSSNDINLGSSANVKYPVENRRLTYEDCEIKSQDVIELNVSLKFDDGMSRQLQSFFSIDFLNYLRCDYKYDANSNLKFFDNSKVTNICVHLVNELIDNGLINPKDQNLMFDLFYRRVREFLSNKSLVI